MALRVCSVHLGYCVRVFSTELPEVSAGSFVIDCTIKVSSWRSELFKNGCFISGVVLRSGDEDGSLGVKTQALDERRRRLGGSPARPAVGHAPICLHIHLKPDCIR